MGATLLTWEMLMVGAAPDEALAPWGSDHHPTDATKRHVREITDGRAGYVVAQGGTIDGRNCRSPQGVWQPFEQTWEANRSVRVENVGETDVVNPWLSNGQNDFRSLDRIVAKATAIRINMPRGSGTRPHENGCMRNLANGTGENQSGP